MIFTFILNYDNYFIEILNKIVFIIIHNIYFDIDQINRSNYNNNFSKFLRKY